MNIRFLLKSTVCGLLLAVTLPLRALQKENGIRLLTDSVLRQTGNRTYPYPVKGHRLITNPPTFTWPSADYRMPATFPVPLVHKGIDDFLRYDIQIGRTPDFSDSFAYVQKGLRLAFYNPHTALAPGVWYWRYRTAGKAWSATYEVNIPSSLKKFEAPQSTEAYAMIPSGHPHISKIPENGRQWTADQKQLIQAYLQKAEAALDKDSDSYTVKGKPIPPSATKEEKVQIEKFRLRYEVEALDNDIINLLRAYLYSKDEAFLNKALEMADYIARKDGEHLYKAADFTGAFSMSTLAMAYDVAYDRLSPERRLGYERFISKVMYWNMAHAMQENVGSADGILFAHFFQHTFYCAFTTAIIMKGHLPEAETWFGMLYDIWLSRTPGGGFLADGAWPNGNMGYLHVNMESMVDNFVLFRDLFNVNLFSHPWYANCANALAYTQPVHSAGDGFGDGCERWTEVNKLRADFAYILSQELENPFAANYAYALSGQSAGTAYSFSGTAFANYRLGHRHKELRETELIQVPQSALFPETGIVTMNTDVLDTSNNLFVSFMSSPFGVGSHGMAEQNSFNLSYQGKPIFYPTGYRLTTQDKHYLLAQKHSRAKNTITVNGKTQAYSSHGYGWIARYLDGKDITYTLGDASNAYKQIDASASNWLTVLKKAGVYKSEDGFIIGAEDNPEVELFRRHLVMLRPNVLVVYDELKAGKEVTWTFQLNGLARSNMRLDSLRQMLVADTDNADAAARIFGSVPVSLSLVDTNYVKPFDWINPQRGRKARIFEAHQYHGKVENRKKCRQMRFLAIIQIDKTNKLNFSEVNPDENGEVRIKGYRIKAQMDTKQDARLEIENMDTGEYLLYGPSESSQRAGKRNYSHSTLLINPSVTGADAFKEAIDAPPLMIPPTR